MLARILGGIYLSSIEPLNQEEDLHASHSITHILSVISGPIPHQSTYTSSPYTHKQIDITDEETSNILDHFDEALAFMHSAIVTSKSTVLVHCAQGSSRSVIVVMAYLMKYYKLTMDQSLYAIRRKFEGAVIEPNQSFLQQLKVYETIGLSTEGAMQKPVYRQYRIELALKQDPSGQTVRDLNMFQFTSDTELEAETETERETEIETETEPQNTQTQSDLRCKRCRQTLAKSSHIELHDIPDLDSRQSQFIKTAPNSRRIISVQSAASSCSHFFLIEPLNWMKDELALGNIEGKFQCPKCQAKVGGYSWRGSRCSCGKWMVPALHLQTAKVDEIKPFQLHQHT
ncbi:protein-tyrosine phosphatase-like protein [Scheffersomyces amazonensis]|uniref:protein-tyrosine phosphatase-like protein n=1 Tax=Scheffersomyces amazonensis TaxID=1078765 RepID=UPI00315DAD5C